MAQRKRTIKVLSSKTNEKVVLETKVTTWGELKELLEEKEVYESGMNAVISPSKQTLALDEAELPEGDFKIVLSQTKMKAGLYSDRKLKEMRTKFNNLMDSVRKVRSTTINQQTVEEVSKMLNTTVDDLLGTETTVAVKKTAQPAKKVAVKKEKVDPDFAELQELADELN